MGPYTNACCRLGGNNLNAGLVTGDSTIPGTSPLVTYTNGQWNSATNIYIAPVGADLTEAVVGRWAPLYHDGDTSPVTNQYLVARITAVDVGTRSITLSDTARALLGTEVTSSPGGRSLRIGGAWVGPSGTSMFPFNLTGLDAIMNTSSHRLRINFKSDLTSVVSAGVTTAAISGITIEGFTTAYGDGGIWVLDGGSTGAAYTPLATPITALRWTFRNVEFKGNGATGGSGVYGLSMSGDNWLLDRCVFRDLRGPGFRTVGYGLIRECEFYNCNVSNTASQGGVLVSSGGNVILQRCIFHDNPGSNTAGVHIASSEVQVFSKCIFDSNGGHGINSGGVPAILIANCDFYANGRHGVFLASSGTALAENSNFVDNGENGILVSGNAIADIVNCGFGRGTKANVLGDINATAIGAISNETGSVAYTNDLTPWNAPDTGDFSIVLAAAKGTGIGSFLQTASGYTGTDGTPDIGASDAVSSGDGGGISRRIGIGL